MVNPGGENHPGGMASSYSFWIEDSQLVKDGIVVYPGAGYLTRILADEGAKIIESASAADAAKTQVVINDLGRGVTPPAALELRVAFEDEPKPRLLCPRQLPRRRTDDGA
jgi:hypothetical protein